MANRSNDTIILWPEGAPGAQGRDPEDIPRLNSYIIDASKPSGAIIICPGGGYGGRAYHEGEPVTRWLNSLELSAFVLQYRVAPYRHPCYPVITFGEYRHHGSMINLLGENPPPELRHLLSNETQVTNDTPPAFIWHTCEDAAVPVENSLLFAEALSRHSVPFALHIFPSGPHGLGLAESHPDVGMWTELCHQWLQRLGFCPGREASL